MTLLSDWFDSNIAYQFMTDEEQRKATIEKLLIETRPLVKNWDNIKIIDKTVMNENQNNTDLVMQDSDAASEQSSISRIPRPSRALKPDAQAFDEIRIITVPRYKDSELSGAEWRISAEMQFYRKGKLIFTDGCSNVENACYLLGAKHMIACDNAMGYFAGEGDICDQEGCSQKATVTYRVKKEFSRDNPHEWNKEVTDELKIRKFCNRHKTRGDSSFDDSDVNYEEIPFIHTEERKQKD